MKRIIIFGVGYYGRAILRMLNRSPEEYNIICFIDNNNDLDGSELFGIPIFAPNKLIEIDFELIVMAGGSTKDQVAQLENDFNISSNKFKVLKKSDVTILNASREKKTIEMINILVEVLNKNNLNYWFDYSSLLAIYRKDDFSHFSDVDVSLISNNDMEVLFKELSCLENNSIEVKKFYTKDSSPRKVFGISMTSIVDLEKEEPATIGIAIKLLRDGNYYSDINGRESCTPMKYFSGFIIKYYLGLKLRVPLHTKEYLEHVYGSEWYTPAEYWHVDSYRNLIN